MCTVMSKTTRSCSGGDQRPAVKDRVLATEAEGRFQWIKRDEHFWCKSYSEFQSVLLSWTALLFSSNIFQSSQILSPTKPIESPAFLFFTAAVATKSSHGTRTIRPEKWPLPLAKHCNFQWWASFEPVHRWFLEEMASIRCLFLFFLNKA